MVNMFCTPFGMFVQVKGKPRVRVTVECEASIRGNSGTKDERAVKNYLRNKNRREWVSLHKFKKSNRWTKSRLAASICQLIKAGEIRRKRFVDLHPHLSGLKWRRRWLYQLNAFMTISKATLSQPTVPLQSIDLSGFLNGEESILFGNNHRVTSFRTRGWLPVMNHRTFTRRVSQTASAVVLLSGILSPKTSHQLETFLNRYLDLATESLQTISAREWLLKTFQDANKLLVSPKGPNRAINGWEGASLTIALVSSHDHQDATQLDIASIGSGDGWVYDCDNGALESIYSWDEPTETTVLQDRTVPLEMGWCPLGKYLGIPQNQKKTPQQREPKVVSCRLNRSRTKRILLTLGFRGNGATSPRQPSEGENATFTPAIEDCIPLLVGGNGNGNGNDNGANRVQKKEALEQDCSLSSSSVLATNLELADNLTVAVLSAYAEPARE